MIEKWLSFASRIKVLFGRFGLKMFAGFASASINTAVLLWCYRLYVRELGYEQYGLWLICTTVLSFLQMGNVGVCFAVAKIVAEDYESGDLEGARRQIATALKVAFVGAILLDTFVWLQTPRLVQLFGVSPEKQATASALLPWIAALSTYAVVTEILAYALAGIGRIHLLYLCQSVATIVAALVSVTLLSQKHGLYALLLGQSAGYLVQQAGSAFMLRRALGRLRVLQTPLEWQAVARLISMSRSLVGSSLLQLLMVPANRLLLANCADLTAVSVYEIAHNGAMRIRNLFENGLRALMPEVSALSASTQKAALAERMAELMQRTNKWVFSLIVPFYLLLIAVVPYIASFWLGSDNLAVLAPAVRIALIGTLLSLLGVPAYYMLLGLGSTGALLAEKALHWAVSVAIILAVFTVSGQATSLVILAAGSAGMAASTLYLTRQCNRLLRKLRSDHADDSVAACDYALESSEP